MGTESTLLRDVLELIAMTVVNPGLRSTALLRQDIEQRIDVGRASLEGRVRRLRERLTEVGDQDGLAELDEICAQGGIEA